MYRMIHKQTQQDPEIIDKIVGTGCNEGSKHFLVTGTDQIPVLDQLNPVTVNRANKLAAFFHQATYPVGSQATISGLSTASHDNSRQTQLGHSQ
ncbi:hypothetical protein Lmac_0619 [Legionella maceachernii]|uniref:Uncharacterized protein n=2 Tax=Legionella maceachernii TaxID=466 RepID=A0A0W0WDY2_9GAMM|nr:hypothetical protein Lmac_0619 [Legionella maceachernii]SJZ69160.1 hypothetical protein SAMN02745128_00794 [Legionella maceachernii]SUP02180.1 Uncharacterised protein [Legionella maceachernii]